MDPYVVFDCESVLPNRFALALAAAARRRALASGAQPRLDAAAIGKSELALHEIAQGVFTSDELGLFLTGSGEATQLACPDYKRRFAAAATTLLPHPPPLSRRRSIDDANQPKEE
jgi:DNA-directed RNA polymerase subunit omega